MKLRILYVKEFNFYDLEVYKEGSKLWEPIKREKSVEEILKYLRGVNLKYEVYKKPKHLRPGWNS